MEETSEHGILGRNQYCSEERIEVLSNTIERYHSSRNTPSLLYSESCSDGNWRSFIRKVYMSPRRLPKISLKHDWMNELGPEVAQRPQAGQVVQQFKSSQSNQPNPNPDHDRTGTPVVGSDPRTALGARKTSRSQEIETRSFHEEADKHDRTGTPVVCCDASHAQGAYQTCSSHESTNFNVGDVTNHDRTGTPVVCRDASHAQVHEQSMLNEVDIDFRKHGLPHAVVKQAETFSCS